MTLLEEVAGGHSYSQSQDVVATGSNKRKAYEDDHHHQEDPVDGKRIRFDFPRSFPLSQPVNLNLAVPSYSPPRFASDSPQPLSSPSGWSLASSYSPDLSSGPFTSSSASFDRGAFNFDSGANVNAGVGGGVGQVRVQRMQPAIGQEPEWGMFRYRVASVEEALW